DRREPDAIVIQSLRQPGDQRLVLPKQPNVAAPHRRIVGPAVPVRRGKEVLDHAVSAQQIDAADEQLRVRGDGLAERIGELDPPLDLAAAAGSIVRLEQRHEVLDQQREVERVRRAGAQNDGPLVERRAVLKAVMTELRAQMTADHLRVGLLNLDAVLVREGLRDALRDVEVARELVRRGALRQWNQPPGIPQEDRLIGGSALPRLVEHALYGPKAFA